MSNEVKRYDPYGNLVLPGDPEQLAMFVLVSDYAALEAECERLRADHGVVAHANLLRDSQAENERDALSAQLEAIRAAGGEAVAWAIADDPQEIGGFAPVYYSLDDAKRWADGKNIIPLCDQRIVAAMAAELERAMAEIEELDALRSRQSDLLSQTAIALRGPEPALTRYSHADIPSRVKAVVAELEAARKQEKGGDEDAHY